MVRCRPVVLPEVEALARCVQREAAKAEPWGRACTDESAEASARLTGRGLRVLGMGRHREAFDVGDCVFKLAKHFEGAQANLLEKAAWHRLRNTRDPKVLRHFLPVVAAGAHGEWLLMPKAADLAGFSGDWKDAVDKAGALIESRGVKCDDLRRVNWGLFKGRPVVLDYGRDLQCRIRAPASNLTPP